MFVLLIEILKNSQVDLSQQRFPIGGSKTEKFRVPISCNSLNKLQIFTPEVHHLLKKDVCNLKKAQMHVQILLSGYP